MAALKLLLDRLNSGKIPIHPDMIENSMRLGGQHITNNTTNYLNSGEQVRKHDQYYNHTNDLNSVWFMWAQKN